MKNRGTQPSRVGSWLRRLRAAPPWDGLRRRAWTLEMASTCDGLGRLLAAGITLPLALTCQLDTATTTVVKRALIYATRAVEHGLPLSKAWETRGAPLFLALLQASEVSGALPVMLEKWSRHVRRQQNTKQELVKLCGYPVFVMVSNLMLMLFVGHRVIPSLESLASQLGAGAEHPHEMWMLTWLNHGPMWIASMVFGSALLMGVVLLIRSSMSDPNQFRLLGYVPGATIHRLSRTSSFCMLLSMLLNAGLPLTESLETMERHVGPPWIRQTASAVLQRLMQGCRIREAFLGDWHPILFTMVGWAEYTGDLPEALYRVHEIAHEALVQRVRWAMRIAEPVMLMVLGGMVLSTMASIFVPLYDQLASIESNGLR